MTKIVKIKRWHLKRLRKFHNRTHKSEVRGTQRQSHIRNPLNMHSSHKADSTKNNQKNSRCSTSSISRLKSSRIRSDWETSSNKCRIVIIKSNLAKPILIWAGLRFRMRSIMTITMKWCNNSNNSTSLKNIRLNNRDYLKRHSQSATKSWSNLKVEHIR